MPIERCEVFDVQGAGDTAIAALTLARLRGRVAARGGRDRQRGGRRWWCAKVGTATATAREIRAAAARRGVAAARAAEALA